MNTFVVLMIFFVWFTDGVTSVADEAFDCYMCSGDRCKSNPPVDSCPSGHQCYKMEVRRNTDVDSPFIIKGCTKDQTFWKRSCYDDCRENQHFGVEKSRICIYCCDDYRCNSAIKTNPGFYGILLAFSSLLAILFL